jgi:hypothetical protein
MRMHVRGRPVIVLEFNELCPELLAEWMDRGLLPNFRKFHSHSRVFTAQADVTEQRHLEPWIQWYSLHTGFSYEQHRVFHLTDGPKRGLKDIWRLLLENGYAVANCAGMNAPGFGSPGSFYLPDPWCNSQEPYPQELQAYQRLVLTKVQENSNAAASPQRAAYLQFLQFWMTHGASTNSIGAIVRQFVREASGRNQSWKRATLLDKVQFDIFSHYWRRLKPDFASFFINSTAHFQHAYFHLLRPEGFEGLAQPQDDSAHKDAVLFGYQEMDGLLARFFELEKEGALLVFSTALSQRQNPDAGQIYYRPHDINALLGKLGVQPARLLPVMAHQYSAEFPNQEAAEQAMQRLAAILYRGAPIFDLSIRRPSSLFFGVGAHGDIPRDAQLEFPMPESPSIAFYDVFYRLPHTKSGIHQGQSALWFKTGDFQVHDESVSILDVLPTLLEYYGVDAPEEEGMRRGGVSILQKLGIAPYSQERAGEPTGPPRPTGAFPEAAPGSRREPAQTDAR